jgi:oligopeptide transport system permease protein
MLRFILRRILVALPTLLVIVTITFFMMRLTPGGPFDRDRRLPPEIEANLRASYHLDEPLLVQFGRYVVQLLHGDFGPSFKYPDRSVTDLIAGGAPISFQLGLVAIALAGAIGIALGLVAAWRQNSWLDHGVMALAMTGIAVPNFVMAPLLALVFGVMLHWLPVQGWNGLKWSVLPTAALTLPYIAAIARLTRGSALDVLNAEFIRTARAKGLPERIVLLRHALKPTLLPVVSFLGPATAGIITGSVVIENIFQIPGLGRYFIQGGLNRDYTLVLGVVVFYGVLIILFNLVVDLAYGLLDPRIRAGR